MKSIAGMAAGRGDIWFPWKCKSFKMLLVIELILTAATVIGLFGKQDVLEYDVESAAVSFGTYTEGQNGAAVTATEGNSGLMLSFSGISLSPGTYRVRLHYATDTDGVNQCSVQDGGLSLGTLRTNGTGLFAGLNHSDYEMWLMRSSGNIAVEVYYGGTGFLTVDGLTICQTNAGNRILLFVALCVCVAVNAAYGYIQYDRQYKISRQTKIVFWGLLLTIFAASMPVCVDYIVGSRDLVYHLMRIEGIKDGLLSGQFPVRISPEWIQGNGYASPIFYGETLLYPAAIFRLIGFCVTTSYRIVVFLIAAATVLIAYFSFKRMFDNAYIGLFCSMLYTVSIYRIYNTFIKSAYGEMFGIMLLPLIFYGFWKIFTQDVREKSYKRSWIPLTVGFTLLFQSHLLTCEMAGFFAMLGCLILWKRTFRLPTLTVLLKAAAYSVLLSAWFMIPFLDYIVTGDFVIHHVSGRRIQERGLYPAHLLFTFFLDEGNVFFADNGMAHSAAVGVGIAPVMGLLVGAVLFLTGKIRRLQSKEVKLAGVAGVISLLAMLMSLNIFPWDRIQALGKFAATLVSSIQFPNRFLTIANVCLTVVAGVVLKYFMECGKKGALLYAAGTVFCIAVSALHMQDGLMNSMPALRVYNQEGMGAGYISGAEYLPYGVDSNKLTYHNPICSGVLTFEEYEKRSLGAYARMTNRGNETENAAFSLLYYKGYHAWDESGQELNCYAGANGEVTVDIPEGYDGAVNVKFVSPWYWRLGEAVTLATLLGMGGYCVYARSRHKMKRL